MCTKENADSIVNTGDAVNPSNTVGTVNMQSRKINRVGRIWKIYFSPTGTTKKVVDRIAGCLADNLSLDTFTHDFTLPPARKDFAKLNEEDLVIFGCPTYAGRLPNLLLPYLETICGNGALAIPVVTFGNRACDNSLAELQYILDTHEFRSIAAAAFSCEHSFSYTLGGGRPDDADLMEADTFALSVFGLLIRAISLQESLLPPTVDGNPQAPYYKPQDRNGNFIDIRKVKPLTSDACTNCGICADVCPMGAVSHEDFRQVPGICIKCGACIKKCPHHAKYYDDAGYLYHKAELEAMYGNRRAANRFFI